MAIEFNCPYCTSTIRVPDDASGKKGTCPRCETPIMVPVIEVQSPTPPGQAAADAAPPAEEPLSTPAAAVPPESPPAAVDAPSGGEPVFPGPPVDSAGEFSVADQPFIAAADPTPSYARALKRRRKKGGIGLVVPLLFGLCLVGFVIFLWLQNRPTLYGEMTAEVLTEFDGASGGIGKGDVSDLEKDVVQSVIDGLQEDPERLVSGLMETEFRGGRTGVEVKVFAGPETTFFRVALRKNKDFDNWVVKNADVLEKPRIKEYQAAVKQFFVEYNATDGDVADLAGYRDSMGINALVTRVGYNMVALVGTTAYRCVYEDSEQRLYFLLPKKTTQFELVGRQLDDGEKIFPGSYQVKVQ